MQTTMTARSGQRSRRSEAASAATPGPSPVAARTVNPGGSRAGNTKRVTSTAVTRPAMEKSPSWPNPGKPDKSMAANPQMEVNSPNRSVGQIWASESAGGVPAVICVKR